MKGFVVISLCLFAAFAVAGMITPFLLAAKNRTCLLAVLAFATGAWAVIVLLSAAWML